MDDFLHARATAADDILRRFTSLAGQAYHDHDIIHEPFLTAGQVNAILDTLRKEFVC